VRDIVLRILSGASLVVLAPILFVQGRYVRRVTPRLPPVDGPHDGVTSTGANPLRLLIVGESPAVGVGVTSHDEGLAGSVARTLAASTRRPIAWRVVGRSGASVRQVATELVAPAAPIGADIVVVAFGVNDTISLSPVGGWVAGLESLLQIVRRGSPDAAIVVSGVPPMQHFPAFPAPLRHVLGLRAHVLDRAAIRWTRRHTRIAHVPHPRTVEGNVSAMFCADRFHPSTLGYAHWGRALAAAASDILGP
jgi:lysophospholipase L1-like esterase